MPISSTNNSTAKATEKQEQEENGMTSVLDGILPKDPKFGKMEEDDDDKAKSGNGMLASLLEKKVVENHVVNGVGSNKEIKITDKGLEMVNSQDYKKMNGGLDTEKGHSTLKRPASTTELDGEPQAKSALVDGTAATTNGIAGEENNGSPILKTDVNLAQAAVNSVAKPVAPQQVIVNALTQQQQQQRPQTVVTSGQRVITNAAGQQIVVQPVSTANIVSGTTQSGSNPGQQKTIIILQQQSSSGSTSASTSTSTTVAPQQVVIRQQVHNNVYLDRVDGCNYLNLFLNITAASRRDHQCCR